MTGDLGWISLAMVVFAKPQRKQWGGCSQEPPVSRRFQDLGKGRTSCGTGLARASGLPPAPPPRRGAVGVVRAHGAISIQSLVLDSPWLQVTEQFSIVYLFIFLIFWSFCHFLGRSRSTLSCSLLSGQHICIALNIISFEFFSLKMSPF